MHDPAHIDLFWLSRDHSGPPEGWSLGEVFSVPPFSTSIGREARRWRSSGDALLVWDPALGHPPEDRLQDLLREPGDVWHAGLRLGAKGRPRLLNSVAPTWMFNADAEGTGRATSWRLSLRACLFRRNVVPALGRVDPSFKELLGSGLMLGHSLLMSGAIVRYVDDLVAVDEPPEELPLDDELRFVRARYGRFWAAWAGVRAKKLGFSGGNILSAGLPRRYPQAAADGSSEIEERPIDGHREATVSVIIPTVDRYPYVRTLLGQLRTQSHQAREIFVVDQTPPERRDADLASDFGDLPLEVFHHQPAGQSSSRNRALRAVAGSHVLLLDDDIEIGPDLIEKHLRLITATGADASCGVVDEVGAGPPPPSQLISRPSDVFPAGNTLVKREALRASGLFDLAYERGARADHDLGMRLYLAGKLALLNPEARVLHHRATRGGLRTHGARLTTYAASRNSLLKRAVPSATEVYLWMRYFSPLQVDERLRISVMGTLSRRGHLGVRLVRAAIAVILLPLTVRRVRASRREATEMLQSYPQIDGLPEEPGA